MPRSSVGTLLTDADRRFWLQKIGEEIDGLAAQHEHFMPVALPDSQLATLQEPTLDEHLIAVDVGGRSAEIGEEIAHQLEQRQRGDRHKESKSGATTS
jgi:gluconate kinase